MIPRPILAVLVFVLPLLVVALAIVLGAAAVAQAVLDVAVAQVLRWAAVGIALLLAVDLILLVGVLGLQALAVPNEPSQRSEE